ncbi:glycosyltransferase [Candidatus Desantisbacteria bacterium]|nr:glycosyltransferase [Candidatus Desantisbacteria bacterium]
MKIGITCYPTYGGSSTIACELGLELLNRGHEVYFICYDLPQRIKKSINKINFYKVDVVPYPLFKFPPYTMALASKMYECIKIHKLDILHVHYAIPHSTSAYLAREMAGKCNTKIITTLHGTDIRLLGMDPIRPIKNLPHIINTFFLIQKQIPAILLMVGDGPERHKAENLVKTMKIEKHVDFIGERDDIENILKNSDLLLLLSENESFGLVAIEAMSCGVPVIATNVGGLLEIIKSGKNGFLVEPGDIASAGNMALKILKNEKIQNKMRFFSRDFVEMHFSLAKIVTQYEDYYRKILDA